MTAPIYPWLQEPLYEPSPMNGNAVMAWIMAHHTDTYLDNTGMAINLPGGGQWVNDSNAPAIPRGDGTFIANDPQNPNQRLVPADPSNPIWAAGTMYGKDGYDYFELTPLAQEVIAYQKANPTPIPPAILNPPPPYRPPSPPPVSPPTPPFPFSMGWFEAFIERVRARF